MVAHGLNTFDPKNDTRAYRNALGRFATGVTVVTINTENGPVGVTVNSFSSVSMDPPLVLWSSGKKSNRYPAFINSKNFAVHVLAADQKQVCDNFATAKSPFSNVDFYINENGLPILSNCLAVFECDLYNKFDAGDHSIILGHVKAVQMRCGPGLIFTNGTYTTAAE